MSEVIEDVSTIDTKQAIEDDANRMAVAIGRYLRGELPEEDFKKFRLHRGIYGQRPDQKGYNMVRVKIPFGFLNSQQLVCLAGIARDFADGLAHITTRQDIQYHWVKLETVPEVMRRLASTGLTTREACGNSVRNIVGSPLAGVARDEHFDITPYAHLLAKHLLRNSLSQKLPRKFKISFSGSADERDAIIPWINDIGYVAAVRNINGEEKRGFKVFVGGGLGGQPRVADVLEEFVPAAHLIPLTEAIIKVFDGLGNRENRSKARMKYVLWKIGFDEFKKRVGDELREILESERTFPEAEDFPEGEHLPVESAELPDDGGDVEFKRWLDSNVLPQKQDGYNIVYVSPQIGDLTVDQLLALSKLSEEYSDGTVRNTGQQDLVLRWIRSTDIEALYGELKAVNLNKAGALDIANVTSCPGADTCNLGITHSRALGKELTQLFQRQPDWSELLRDLRVKISGCPNSCGQHHVAAIGLHGATKKVEGGEIPSYLISLGGGMNSGHYSFGGTLGRVPARYAAEAVARIVRKYLSQKQGEENFWEFFERVGIRAFRDDVRDLTELRPEAIRSDKSLMVDLGEENAFAAVTGEGECAI